MARRQKLVADFGGLDRGPAGTGKKHAGPEMSRGTRKGRKGRVDPGYKRSHPLHFFTRRSRIQPRAGPTIPAVPVCSPTSVR
jgi:hypothetical protein